MSADDLLRKANRVNRAEGGRFANKAQRAENLKDVTRGYVDEYGCAPDILYTKSESAKFSQDLDSCLEDRELFED